LRFKDNFLSKTQHLFLLKGIILYIYTRMIIQNKRIFASILFVLISFVCMAQELPPPPPPTPPPPGTPIDSGIVILFFLAIVYGVKKSLSVKN